MHVLGLDFETQGTDTETTNITEIGASLTEIIQSDTSPSDMYYERQKLEAFCFDANYPPQPPDVVELTGITDQILREKGEDPKMVLALQLLPMVKRADFIIAYNAQFDHAVLVAACKKYGLTLPTTPWLCAMTEIPYPERFTCRKLAHVAYDHGVLVHPDTLHRAIHDVNLMLRVTIQYKFKDILDFASQPWVYIAADIPKPWTDGGVGKAKAKTRKFSWEQVMGDENKFHQKWVKRVKQGKLELEIKACEKLGLKVAIIT